MTNKVSYRIDDIKNFDLGKNVLIVEDIIDTGKAMKKLLNTLK